jgi:hypothetical protein
MAFLDFFRLKTKHNADEIVAGINKQLSEITYYLSEQGERLRRIETKQKETSLQLEEIDIFLQGGGNETAFIDALISLADIIYDFYYFAGQEEYRATIPLNEASGPNEITNENKSGHTHVTEWHQIAEWSEATEQSQTAERSESSPTDNADLETPVEPITPIPQASPLFEQAQMMWNTAKNTIESAGLKTIEACNEPFDFRLHSVESTEQDNSLPEAYVIKTLKCGYIYKDEIIRRALVIINKTEKIDTMNNLP